MVESVVHFHPGGKLVALVGNPNCGKTALFNGLTGSHQKVANYAGVTVERKEGRLISAAGKALRLLDLPGTYSLHPRSPDERVTCDVLAGPPGARSGPTWSSACSMPPTCAATSVCCWPCADWACQWSWR